MNQPFSIETINLIVATFSFFGLLVIVYFVYKYIFQFFRKKVFKTPGRHDDFIIGLFKIPALWIIYWVLLKLFTHIFLSELSVFPYILHFNELFLIFSLTWIIIKFVKLGSWYLQSKLDVGASDNLNARKRLTRISVFAGIANSIIITIAIAIAMMTFEQARTLGLSLLTSAGVIGIIVGFAAQKSIGMILAGIQLAITQPIRLDDVVVVEGEWGRIEEITLTYVVIKIWDERRLILPVTWFLEKPFQNWTRSNADITGTIFLYVDYSLPVESIRKALPDMLNGNADWDGRTINVQVTNATERFKEVRVLLSSTDASKNWDLRTNIREKLIDFVNENYPDSFAKIRIKTDCDLIPVTTTENE